MFQGCYSVQFWSKTQSKNAERRKIERSAKQPSRVFYVFPLWPPKHKISIKKITYEIKNFQRIQKTKYMLSIYIQTTSIHNSKKKSKKHLYFWLYNGQKIIQTTSMQNSKKLKEASLFLAVQWPENQVRVMTCAPGPKSACTGEG